MKLLDKTIRDEPPGLLPMGMVRAVLLLFFAVVGADALAANPYADKTNQQLTLLTADLDDLSPEQRRALLTELRARMAASSADRQMIEIKTERRYGRIVQHSDGSVVHIETREQIVEYRPAPGSDGQQPFGVGFEHRLAELEAATREDARESASDPDRSGDGSGTTAKQRAAAPPTLPVIRADTGSP